MSYEQKPGQGSLFKNDKKSTEQHPDYKGSITLPDGTECWMSAWVKRPEGKTPFMSISIQPKDQSQPAPQTAAPIQNGSDLPF